MTLLFAARPLLAAMARQPHSWTIVVPALGVGMAGAMIAGLTLGFDDTDDPAVGTLRILPPIITGAVAGLVARGLWGWVAASVGAAIGMGLMLWPQLDLTASLVGGIPLSMAVLGPGYAVVRTVAGSRRLLRMATPDRRRSLHRLLRRALQVGVVLCGAGVLVAAIVALASLGLGDSPLRLPVVAAAILGSYGMYRAVDRVGRGERGVAVVFTLVYGAGSVALFDLMMLAQDAVTTTSAVTAAILVMGPGFFMALAPWVLARGADEQMPLPAPTRPEPPPTPGRAPATLWQPVGSAGQGPGAPREARRDASNTMAGLIAVLVAVVAFAVVAVWLASPQDGGSGLGPGTAGPSHDAPEVEALLPTSVGGRPLLVWSVRGEGALALWGLSPDEIAATSRELESLGVSLDDVVQATAGRSTRDDPPYFVLAFRIPEAARDLLGGYAIAAAGFTRDTDQWEVVDGFVGGKPVSVGPTDLLVQSEHQRGRPYLYGSTALGTSFIVITDDEAWAEEALLALPI